MVDFVEVVPSASSWRILTAWHARRISGAAQARVIGQIVAPDIVFRYLFDALAHRHAAVFPDTTIGPTPVAFDRPVRYYESRPKLQLNPLF